MPSYRLITAGIILIGYFIIAGILLANLYDPAPGIAPEWDHVLVIFNAIGAFATMSAGVLLGVEIQQDNVSTAIKDAERLAASAAGKDAAMRQALEHLESDAGVAMNVGAPSDARLALLRALGT